MFANKQEELDYVTKKIVKIQILGAPGAILVGLAFYAIFGAQGDAFHPLLNNMDVVYSMLVVGGLIMVWEFMSFWKLIGRKKRLQSELSEDY